MPSFNVRVQMEGVERVIATLSARSRAAAAAAAQKVVVGYDAPYAVYVHENLTTHHTNGQAKFLEQPARVMKAELASIAYNALRRGATLVEAELEAGQRLLDASKQLVPVDTGQLRDSGFVRVE
jgi:hypothetical protein